MSKFCVAPSLDEEEIQGIYEWVDSIPLSRPKRNITRDFSDGVPVAEAVKYFIPGLVDIHNYIAASSTRQKLNNWNTLNIKVFKKMGFQLAPIDIEACVNCVPDAIERVLKLVQIKIEEFKMGVEQEPISRSVKVESKIDLRVLKDQPQASSNDNRDESIQNMRETIEILELKVKKLEHMMKIKENKIEALTKRLADAGLY